jgi:hypothetical protein
MLRRLSQNAAAAIVGAAAFAVLTAGTAAAVAYSSVAITDASSGTKAHVTGKQSLVTSQRDPFSGTYAKVDANGRSLVAGNVVAQDAVGTTPHAETVTGYISGGIYLSEVMSAALSRGFVIQSISGYIEVANAVTPTITVLVYQNPSPASWSPIEMPLTYKSKNGTYDHYQFALDLTAFARKDSQIIVDTSRNDATGTEQYRVTFLGYYV